MAAHTFKKSGFLEVCGWWGRGDVVDPAARRHAHGGGGRIILPSSSSSTSSSSYSSKPFSASAPALRRVFLGRFGFGMSPFGQGGHGKSWACIYLTLLISLALLLLIVGPILVLLLVLDVSHSSHSSGRFQTSSLQEDLASAVLWASSQSASASASTLQKTSTEKSMQHPTRSQFVAYEDDVFQVKLPVFYNGPIVIGGLGGSGTRAVAKAMEAMGVHMGVADHLNGALDNVCTSLTLRNVCVREVNEALAQEVNALSETNAAYSLAQKVIRELGDGSTANAVAWSDDRINAANDEVRRSAKAVLAWIAVSFLEYWRHFSAEHAGQPILGGAHRRRRRHKYRRDFGQEPDSESLSPRRGVRRRRALRDDGKMWLDPRSPPKAYGLKNPSAIYLVPALARLFPNMIFVHVVRDGRDFAIGGKMMTMHRLWHTAMLAADRERDPESYQPSEIPDIESHCGLSCHAKRVLFWSVANGNASVACENLLEKDRCITVRTESLAGVKDTRATTASETFDRLAHIVSSTSGKSDENDVRRLKSLARVAVAMPILRGTTTAAGTFDPCQHYGGAKWMPHTYPTERVHLYEVGKASFARFQYAQEVGPCTVSP